ncbi:MAG TPA: response regulator transcription factor [Vicinamibacterales bacterium]|jgi:DNA-binding NarL/FixJ family response regulator|nr:response regulator transcription factor [Vicinamibacterales bacterium]
MIRILIADDHPVIRQGVRQIASGTDDLRVVDDAIDARTLLEKARAVEHDIVLLDLSMPGTNGLDVLKQLRRERPKIPVLILTMYAEDQFAIRALKAGASGYVVKACEPAELIGAVRRVAAGGRYISMEVAEGLARHLADDTDKPPHERLSDREYEVFRLIAAGKSTREISATLSLSVKTIGTYRTRIFEKMAMKTVAELAAYVVRNQLGE